MDKPTIQSAVWHAADQLFADGIRPTVANIREITKRGSAGTINQALKEWWHDLSRRVTTSEQQLDVPDAVADAMRNLWAASLERAENALLAYKEDAERQVAEAKSLHAAAEARSKQTEEQNHALEKQIDELHATNVGLQRSLAAEAALRKEAESRIQAIKAEADRMSIAIGTEKERCRTMERRLTAQAEENKTMRRQAEKRLADLQAASAAMENAYRAEILECKERGARQSERTAFLEQRITVLEHELHRAGEKIQSLLNENTMLGTLSSRPLLAAKTSPRGKLMRTKKRRV
jgi:chromosome segregation ATPase